ncbi:MAG: DUF4426 domain-containing protein [Pseudomonadales bacterium]|nr:DUF4426 domain-containing protein [Pseudomonadales bacterium]
MKYACLFCLALSGLPALADVSECGAYRIYYTTFPSTLVPPGVAEAHGITRSDSRLITNVTVKRGDEPVPATVTGRTRNLLNQLEKLGFVEVREQDAIYYLASQVVDERDTLDYEVSVTPQGAAIPCDISFRRNYFGSPQ